MSFDEWFEKHHGCTDNAGRELNFREYTRRGLVEGRVGIIHVIVYIDDSDHGGDDDAVGDYQCLFSNQQV